MRKSIFWGTALYHEQIKRKDQDTEIETSIILPLDTYLAASPKEVEFKIARKLEEQYADNPESVEIIIRPF